MNTQQDQTVYTLPISQILSDERYQPRHELNEAHVRLLLASDPDTWPPLQVSPVGDGRYIVIDGFHRLEAARRLKLFTVPCAVVPGAGYPEAFAANLQHGLALTLADRKAFARWLHEREPLLSHREIGRRTGLSDKTVTRALREDHAAESPRPAPDPVARFVSTVHRVAGRDEVRVATLRAEIQAYAAEWQPEIAAALDAVGQTCITAAQPYLAEER